MKEFVKISKKHFLVFQEKTNYHIQTSEYYLNKTLFCYAIYII